MTITNPTAKVGSLPHGTAPTTSAERLDTYVKSQLSVIRQWAKDHGVVHVFKQSGKHPSGDISGEITRSDVFITFHQFGITYDAMAGADLEVSKTELADTLSSKILGISGQRVSEAQGR